MPSKLLSAPGDRGTLRGAAGKERAEPRPPRPRTGSEPGADRPGREEGRAGGEVHRGGRDRPGGRGVPAATRAGLALPCPCGSPGWVTRWGCTARGCRGAPWDTHTHTHHSPRRAAGLGSGARPGPGELRGLQLLREAAATGSAHHIPPLARPTRIWPQTRCAAEPGPPPLRLLRPGSVAAARHSSRRLPTAPRWLGSASGRAELAVSIPQASPSARGHIHRPGNADALRVCPAAC